MFKRGCSCEEASKLAYVYQEEATSTSSQSKGLATLLEDATATSPHILKSPRTSAADLRYALTKAMLQQHNELCWGPAELCCILQSLGLRDLNVQIHIPAQALMNLAPEPC